MKILRKKFSDILNTSGAFGFRRGRKYDQDMNRLGRMDTSQRELMTGNLGKEMRELNKELNNARLGLWQRDTD